MQVLLECCTRVTPWVPLVEQELYKVYIFVFDQKSITETNFSKVPKRVFSVFVCGLFIFQPVSKVMVATVKLSK
jgi:hypothetical protein